MTQPNEQLIETIERALEATTPGKWTITDNPLAPEYLKVIDNLKGNIGKSILTEDAYLIANAPEWLRALLEENKRLESIEHTLCLTIGEADKVLQQTRESVNHWKKGATHWEKRFNETLDTLTVKLSELAQVKAELGLFDQRGEVIEKQLNLIESLRAELSAKDKVLESYASDELYTIPHLGCSPMVMVDRGKAARSILSQYKAQI